MKEKESVLVRRARACTTLTHRLSTLLSNDVHSTHNVCICMEQYFVSAYLSVSYDLFNGNKSLGLWNHHFYLSISVITHFFYCRQLKLLQEPVYRARPERQRLYLKRMRKKAEELTDLPE